MALSVKCSDASFDCILAAPGASNSGATAFGTLLGQTNIFALDCNTAKISITGYNGGGGLRFGIDGTGHPVPVRSKRSLLLIALY